jgi:hypothetical protein
MIEIEGLGTFEARKPNAAGLRILLESIDLQSVDQLISKMQVLAQPDESDEDAGRTFLNTIASELGGIAAALERIGPAVFSAFARPVTCDLAIDAETLNLRVEDIRGLLPFDAPLEIINEAAAKGILASIGRNLGNVMSLLPKAGNRQDSEPTGETPSTN